MVELRDFTTLSFDCYGTLIDWETGIWDALQPMLMENDGEEIARETVLQVFGEEEHLLEKSTPVLLYPEVLRGTHGALARRFGLHSTPERDAAFAASLPHWPAFPDTAAALRLLKKRYRLVILSNVHCEGFAASNQKLGARFDAVYTAEDIGSYKPSPRNFEYLLERLGKDFGVKPNEILHTAQSLFHDHLPARALGIANCWIDRQGLSRGGDWGATTKVSKRPEVDFLFDDLRSLAESAR